MIKNFWMEFPHPLPDEMQVGDSLFNEYQSRGYLHRTISEMLRLPTGTITRFYRRLAETRQLMSPVRHFADSRWMVDADFCFVNIRATGLGKQPGNFIQAVKMLPAIRANAIHLGPFTEYDFNTIYAVRSVHTISPHVVDPQSPLSAEDQLWAFVQAAHLLGKTVGFDLEPHVAQFSIPVITRPELFRWYKLSGDKTSLEGGVTEDQMLAEPYQRQIIEEVRAIVIKTMDKEALQSLEAEADDTPEKSSHKQSVYFGLIGVLIERGYWPIPSQSWAGQGVPAFAGYNFDGKYARFDYRGRDNEDLSGSAFHILTPYKFYSGLHSNHASEKPELHQPAVDYFGNIFSYWRDAFDFDFIRYDSVDHIFDSCLDSVRTASDRPTPHVLQICIERSKSPEKPYIGNFAERMGNEIEDYANLGFDVILGDDMLQKVDAALLEKSFQLYDRLKVLNRTREQLAAIAFCVDTHDTGNPAFWGEPLVKAAGAAQMRMRHFVSRFLSVGSARRPKYEVMGSQDLSYGLYQSNISLDNLVWVGDTVFNQHYHFLEDIYEQHKLLLQQGEIVQRQVESSFAWWLIASDRYWIIPFISFANTGAVRLDLPVNPGNELRKTLFDLDQLNAYSQKLSVAQIEIPSLPAGTTRLYIIKEEGKGKVT